MGFGLRGWGNSCGEAGGGGAVQTQFYNCRTLPLLNAAAAAAAADATTATTPPPPPPPPAPAPAPAPAPPPPPSTTCTTTAAPVKGTPLCFVWQSVLYIGVSLLWAHSQQTPWSAKPEDAKGLGFNPKSPRPQP